MGDTPSAPVAALLERFHAAKPVRAWSLIVTLYGDAVMPRGGSLWLGSLIAIMDLFGIDAGHVRTAMSRLTADGWLDRGKVGRNSFYRLSRRGERDFAAATRRIYVAGEPAFDGRLWLALLGPGVDDRAAVRPALERAGFVPLSPTAYVAARPPTDVAGIDGVFVLAADAGEVGRALAATAWKLAPLAGAYRGFIDRFGPLDAALDRTALSDSDALVARTLLIHQFRRSVLRDPDLPAALLPVDWPGQAARTLAARIYRRVVPSAERLLDRIGQCETGPLPAPETGFSGRFGAATGSRGRIPEPVPRDESTANVTRKLDK
jgi:phenylacetic acid degradation operon negative regulatory protein